MNKFPLTTSYARYKCENNLLCTQTYKSPKYAVRVNILIFYCFMQHYETIPLKKFLHILWLDSAKNHHAIIRTSSKVFYEHLVICLSTSDKLFKNYVILHTTLRCFEFT